jgi:hypothetical protein
LNHFEKLKKKKDKRYLVESYRSRFKEVAFKIEGIWTKEIKFDGESYYKVGELPKHKVAEFKRLLPSDSSFRKDLIAMRQGNLNAA